MEIGLLQLAVMAIVIGISAKGSAPKKAGMFLPDEKKDEGA